MKELTEIRQIILLSERRSKRHPHLKTVRDCVAMQWVSRFSSRKSPLAPLFQRGVVRRDSEELVTACKKFPLFERGIKGDFVGKKNSGGNFGFSLDGLTWLGFSRRTQKRSTRYL